MASSLCRQNWAVGESRTLNQLCYELKCALCRYRLDSMHTDENDQPCPRTWNLTVLGLPTLAPPPPRYMGLHCRGTPPPRHGTPLNSDILWPSLESCSNLFTSGPLPLLLTSAGYLSMYGQHKQVVRILWEYFLVLSCCHPEI